MFNYAKLRKNIRSNKKYKAKVRIGARITKNRELSIVHERSKSLRMCLGLDALDV